MNWLRCRQIHLYTGLFVLISLMTACFPVQLGRGFQADPRTTIKVGFHQEGDVLALLGRPYRKTIDPMGRTILVYLWADGDGNGEKCVIGFNEVGLVHSIEVTP